MMTPRRYLSPTFMQKAAGAIYGGEARRNPQLMSAHTSRIIALLIPNNRLFIVPGGGHLFMLYSLDKVIPEVRGFLNSALPAAA
jgi:pimeloyl-ACP methyl ester carboxylesterase